MTPDTIEITAPLRHSKLGIGSCVVAAVVFIYFYTATHISIYAIGATFTDKTNFDWLGAMALAFFVNLAVSIAGFAAGLALGIANLMNAERKRIFGIAGVILNALPLAFVLGFMIFYFTL